MLVLSSVAQDLMFSDLCAFALQQFSQRLCYLFLA
jgi:hypothetical protein